MSDVIVVGAGPAGNVAAARLSGRGYRVKVLDWRTNVGDKLCTGIIGTECAERFPPDEAHIYTRAKAGVVVSPQGTRYRVARNQPQAYLVDRIAYVESLARRAMEAGADYVLGRRVQAVEVSDRGVRVTDSSGGRGEAHEAELLIIASGFASPLLRMAGLGVDGGVDHMMGCQAVVQLKDPCETEVHLGQEVAPGSFGWLVPLSDSRALVGSAASLNGTDDLRRFLTSSRLAGRVGEVVGKPRRWGIPLKPPARTYGDRVLVVGDAAGAVKPTSGGGIYYAMLSGEMAAEAADAAFAAGDLSARRLQSYERAWRARFARELRIGYYARMLYESLDDRQIERLLSAVFSPAVQRDLLGSDLPFDWHSGLILKVLRRREVAVALASLGPAVARLVSRLLTGDGAREEAPVS